MAYYVRLPDNRDVEFPDDYPREDAIRVARDMFRQPVQQQAAPPAPPEERSLLGGAFSRGLNTLQGNLGSAAEGLGNVTGIESLRNYGAESRRRNEREAEQAQPAERRASFEGADSLGGYARATGQAVAESLPSTGLGLAGGIAGGLLGSLGGPLGAAAGAMAGSSLASLPVFYGSNRQRQIQESAPRNAEGVPTGEGQVSSEGAAFGAAVPQAALEGVTDVLLGRLGRFFRGGAEEVGRSLLPRIATGIGVGAASEVPAEVLQQALERAQAGMELLSPEAYKEYREATIAALAAGGTMGGVVSGALGRRPAPVTAREQEDEALRQHLETLALQRAAENAPQPPAPVAPQPEAVVPNGNEVLVDNGVMAKAAVAPAAAPEAAPSIINLTGMGAGIGDSLREALWLGYNNNSGAMRNDPYVRAARLISEGRGSNMSREEFERFSLAFANAKGPDARRNVVAQFQAAQAPAQAAPEIAGGQPQAAASPPPEAPVAPPTAPMEQVPVEPEALAEPPPVVETPTQVLPEIPPSPVAPTQELVTDEDRFPGITEILRADPAKVEWEIAQTHGKTAGWNGLTEDEKADVYYNLVGQPREFAKAPKKKAKPVAAPAPQPEPIIAPDPAKVAEAKAYVAQQIEAIRKTGKQGEKIASALDAVVQDPSYHPFQAYGAFVAGNAMARVLPRGANHNIEFTRELIKPNLTKEEKAKAEASGIKPEEGAAGSRNAAKQIIEISLAPQALNQVRQTAAHEAFHVLQDYYAKYDPDFMKVANTSFTNNSPISTIEKSIRRKLENTNLPQSNIISEDGKYKTYWQALEGGLGDRLLSAREQQAYTYAALYDAARQGTPMTGLKPSMTRFVNFLRDFFASVKNALKGNGFNNINDLFARVAERGGSQFQEDQFITGKTEREFAAAAKSTGMTLPGFKKWFDGSQVVNADGSPKVMYHGRLTGRDFTEFGNPKSAAIPGKEGPFFFSEDPVFAGVYAGNIFNDTTKTGRIYPVYISAKKIFNSFNDSDIKDLKHYVAQNFYGGTLPSKDIVPFLDMDYESIEDEDDKLKHIINNMVEYITDRHDNWSGLEEKLVQNFIRDNGYDGFYMVEGGDNNLAVYDPKQIKSIFNKFAPGVENEREFAAVANGATGGLPPIGQRVPPMTQAMANSTELKFELNVVAKALGKRFKNLGWEAAPEKVERFFTAFQDHMLPLARMADDINANGGNVSQAMNTYVQQDLNSGVTADMLKKRNEGLYQKLINGIANSKVGMNDFENYLYARHAPERNAYIATINPEMPDGGSGMSTGRAEEVLKAFAREGKIPELENLAKMFDAIIADTNKLRVDSGLTPDFSKMTVDSEGRLLPNWQHYAPLRDFASESADADETINEFRPKGSRMLGAKGREDMQTTGRSRMAGDIVAHAMMQNTQAVIRSQKNAVGQSFLAMIRSNPKQTENIAQILARPMTRTAVVNGVVKVVPDIMYKGRPDILVVKEGGKETVVQIKDPAVARSMIGATANAPTTNNMLIRGMMTLNNYLAKINTAYNPEFIITNFFRDLQTFGINIEQFDVKGLRSDSIRDVRAAMAGIQNVLRDNNSKNSEMGRYYNRLKELGGTNEAYGFIDLDTRIKEINETMAKTGAEAKSWKDMAKVIAPVGKLIEDYNTIVENGIRTSMFKNMVERGINEQQAAYIAKNVTVNFTKGGEHRVFMNAMYLFYNASLQGTMAMANAIARSPRVRKIVAGVVVAGLLQDVLNSMISGEDDDGQKIYDKIPEHILKRSFIMMDPFGITERGYISFPMPYGFNAFFNMGREMSKASRGASEPMDAASNIIWTFAEAFNPVGGTNSFANFASPTFADPAVDIMRNRDFADRPIVPERGGFGVQTPDSQKYWSNTFAPFVGISSFLNEITGGTSVIPGAVDISPNMIQYLTNFATGAVGKFVERTINFATTTTPSMLAGDFADIEVREIPVVRALAGNVTTRNNMEAYMKHSQEVLQVRQEIRAANEAGDSERVAAALERYPGQVEIMDSINKLSRDRSKLSREINTISRNENIPDDVKRDIIKQLREQQNQLVNVANRLYNQRVTNRD